MSQKKKSDYRNLRQAGFFITFAFGIGLMILGIGALLVGLFVMEAYGDMKIVATFSKGLIWVVGVLPILVGAGILFFAFLRSKSSGKALKEKDVLEAAASQSGVLTPARLAMIMGIPTEEADRLLFDMKVRGVADLRANAEGAVEYVFYDLLPAEVS